MTGTGTKPEAAAAEWRFPAEVRGWLSELEGLALARLARGRTVLEIGCWEGRSTICLAQAAERVWAVDTFDGRGTPTPRDTFDAFTRNVERFGLGARVNVRVGTSAAMVPLIEDRVGLAFVDGAHDYESVRADAALAVAKLAPDGLLAFHDYRAFDGDVGGPVEPGVTRAVNELLAAGWVIHSRTHMLVALCRAEAQTVFVGLPRRPGMRPPGEAPGKIQLVRPVRRGRLAVQRLASSLLCLTFNKILAGALNRRATEGLTHFVMQHDDIVPGAGWADVLIGELDRTGFAVVSAVVPLKDPRGLTSTAVRNSATGKTRRLTMAEVAGLPDTFTLDDVRAAGIGSGDDPADDLLAVNTGLWVCRLNDGWVDHFPGFSMTDGLMRDEKTGLVKAGCVPEDWQFSEWLWRRGFRVAATKKVQLGHLGHDERGEPVEYRNDHVWGEWDTDRGDE